MKILVLGAGGQLGQCFNKVINDKGLKFENADQYTFLTRKELDIADFDAVKHYFSTNDYDLVINCAAYTAVDKAEEEKEQCRRINCDAVVNLSENVKNLISFSTDYVIGNEHNTPFGREILQESLSVYGFSKACQELLFDKGNVLIFRTSWLYSEFGNNFFKKILDKVRKHQEVKVVIDQVGGPTYAMDLAKFIVMKVVDKRLFWEKHGVYNFSDNGIASWYDFACAIEECENGENVLVRPCYSEDFKTAAQRPHYSVLDLRETERDFSVTIPYWRESLKNCYIANILEEVAKEPIDGKMGKLA